MESSEVSMWGSGFSLGVLGAMTKFIQRRKTALCPWKSGRNQGQWSRVNYRGLIRSKGIAVIQKLSLQGPKLMTASLEHDEPAGRWGRRQTDTRYPVSRRSL